MMFWNPKVVKSFSFVLTILFGTVPISATAQGAEDPPAAIVCQFEKRTVFSYLTAIGEDGSVTYISPSGVTAGKFGPDGVLIDKPGQVPSDCHGKSLEQLRESGQTREFGG